MIDVFITDDHTMLVEGLAKAIDSSDIARVSNVSANITDCRKALITEQPDILLLDISLPDGSGVDFCKEVVSVYPSVKVIAITSHNEYSTARQMLDNGASGYILKNSSSEEVIEGIQAVFNGRRYICDEIDSLIRRRQSSEIFLTGSERKVLKLIVEGYTNPEIAEKLYLSPLTVKGYRKSLLLKLDVRNTASLVHLALMEKLV
jgi:DNA-binding NarL/FixJ family response regulator